MLPVAGFADWTPNGGHFHSFAKAAAGDGDEATWAKIDLLARKLEPTIRAAFLAAVKQVQSSISLTALAAALESGNIDAAVGMLGDDALAAAYAKVVDPLHGAMGTAGIYAMTAPGFVPKAMSIRFDALNPRIVEFMRAYTGRLIREISTETREAVRGSLIRGMEAGRNPRTVARDVKANHVGLTARQSNAVENFRRELETFHLKRAAEAWNLGGKISRAPGGAQTFAQGGDADGKPTGKPADGIGARRLRDFRFDATLRKALESGKPLTPEQIDKMVGRYAERYRKHRSETIARTEALRATNAGVVEAWEQAVDAGKAQASLLRKRWVVAKDERLCPVCMPIPAANAGVEGFGIDMKAPFVTEKGPILQPPAHPNCRCAVIVRLIEPEMVGKPRKPRPA